MVYFGIPNAGGNVTNQPVEMIEAQFPIRIERYGMVPNSGGPGRHRGAPAYVRTYRMLAEETVVVMRSDRRNHLPYGLARRRARNAVMEPAQPRACAAGRPGHADGASGDAA